MRDGAANPNQGACCISQVESAPMTVLLSSNEAVILPMSYAKVKGFSAQPLARRVSFEDTWAATSTSTL